ncbi:MAG: tRNA (guanosine(46)-N7)-methyltransferase TrmB [Gammaproteobacteria bacterium]|nr:tRNA (guanosine(46)-N7)-methyltransferase TrmB [Gammaproteobacteria bacterium]HRX71434.1 tRNA (guanosine(46)-N7)-methyltransferase TrmB [Candidatus Competibacteraceae bacterium]
MASIPDGLNVNRDLSRPIRSFVRREGRITLAQQRAFTKYWGRFGVETDTRLLDPEHLFGRSAPWVLEIGFGNGESLAAMAVAHPEVNYLGIEAHRPGVGHLLLRATELQLTNLRVMCADAAEALEKQLPDECLERIQIFFPDPWPKARHHKRRFIQPGNVALLARKLKPFGQLHLATDWEDYALSMLDILNATPELVNTVDGNGFTPRPSWRPMTRFEQRGLRLGHTIRDLLFVRAAPGILR